MKRFRLLILCLIIAAAVLSLASCGESEKSGVPTGAFVEYETLTLKWNAVDGAKLYTVRIEREGEAAREFDVSRTYYSLETLDAGKYSVSVKVGGKESSAYTKPIEFVRDEENGLVFRLINGGKAYEVEGKGDATGNISIPALYRTRPVVAIGKNAFFAQNDLTGITIPDSVKTIGESAFASCAYLESANLPSALQTLGKDAFSGCRSLSGKITVPDTLDRIPDGAFAYCSSLTEISFGSGISKIGKSAFTDCSGLSSVIVPNSVTEIGSFAFAACSGISAAELGEGITVIGDFAFSKAIGISEITLPSSVKTIGNGAFYHCTSLTSVNIGDGIETIGHSAFFDTPIYSLGEDNEIYVGNWFIAMKDVRAPSLNIKEGTVGIANNALYGNAYVQAVELPQSVRRIGSLAFFGSALVSIITGGSTTDENELTYGGSLEYIGEQAFSDCARLTTVMLGSYNYASGILTEAPLKSIGDYAFMNCVLLENIQIPKSVEVIGAYAFRGTAMYTGALTGLVYADDWLVDFNSEYIVDTVRIRQGTFGIAEYTFYGCNVIKNVNIPASVQIICRGAFYGCTELEGVTLPDMLKKIEDYTFYSCSKLKIKSLPPMLVEIGRSAFYACGTLGNDSADTDTDTLVIPSGVTHIGDFAFYGCGYRQADSLDGNTETCGIDIIEIGDRVEYIGRCAFYGFKSLKTVRITGAAVIGEKAFYRCPSLRSVVVESSLTEIKDMAFYECDRLAEVRLPQSLKRIGDSAFYKCDSLAVLSVGSSLEYIGEYAFFGCRSLVSVYLPSTVSHIGGGAFYGCESLLSLTLGASVAHIGEHAFYSCKKLTLYFELTAQEYGFCEHWNSTYCPAVWGCEISSDGNYVVSLTVGSAENVFFDTVISAPEKEGYEFLGFAKEQGGEAEYSAKEVAALADGVRLYAVYVEKT